MTITTSFRDTRRLARGTVGLVPTMGFLHEGHLALIREAAQRCDFVVVSVFVNPMQFDDDSDFDAYPQDLDRDAGLALAAGADVVFAPASSDMVPQGMCTRVVVDTVSEAMEGAHRPGHFAGVATIVTKLFAGIQPDSAFFGRKDAQQLALVRTLAADLAFPVDVVGVSTVREPDGLALSSRNTRLAPRARDEAIVLSRGLFAACAAFESGERDAARLGQVVRDAIAGEPSVVLDYVEVADARRAVPVATVTDRSFIAVAATVDGVRLIDNVFLDPATGTADRGSMLEQPSVLYGGN